MVLVTLAVKTLLSISQNGINPITLNIQLGNHLNKDNINASISLSSFPFSGCFQVSVPSLV
jgi:hypothetical protein